MLPIWKVKGGSSGNSDWDVPLMFGGDWNFVEHQDDASQQWKNWKTKFDMLDISPIEGCWDLQNPTWSNR